MTLKSNQVPKGKRVEPVEIFGSKQRVSKGGERFNKAMNEIAKNIKSNFELFTKQRALGIYSDIIANNPVDTGYSRSNWQFNIRPSLNIIGTQPKSDDERVLSPPSVEDANKSTPNSFVYYINNNLPYIEQLEGGSSNQQPSGFVANALFSAAKRAQQQKK